jgi:thioester reductase-like protein
VFHPCVLDGCFQVLAAAIADTDSTTEQKPQFHYVVASIDRLRLHASPGVKLWSCAELRETAHDGSISADLVIYDGRGSEIASIEGLLLKQRQIGTLSRARTDTRRESRGQSVRGLDKQTLLRATGADRQHLLLGHVHTEVIDILSLDPSFPLQPDTRLKDLGLDSLMAMDLMDRLGTTFEFALPATLLSDIATLEQLVQFLDRQLGSGSELHQGQAALALVLKEIEALPESDVERLLKARGAADFNGSWERITRLSRPKIDLLFDRLANGKSAAEIQDRREKLDLSVEAILPKDIDGKSFGASHSGATDAVFLTGATGYLGSFLLTELLRLTDARIYCLVRGGSVDEGRRRLEGELVRRFPETIGKLSRIVPISGDLAKPMLGLSAEDFHYLSRQVDAIYHSAAVVNFLESYEALKPVNVLPAEAILRLASTVRLKAVHFVSSFSVFMSPHYVNAAFVPEQDGPEHWNGLPNGYARSKWVADRLMHQAMSRRIPVCIYRPGFISGDSRTGECKLEDLPQRLIKACIQLGAAPQLANASLDMTPVDFVGSALVHLSLRSDSPGKAFNLVNPAPIAWDRLVEWIRRFGYPIEVVSFQEWLGQLRRADDSNALHALRGLVELTPKELLANLPRFDRRNAIAGLSDTSISCPCVEDLLDTYFSYFIGSGFLHAPVLMQAHAFS